MEINSQINNGVLYVSLSGEVDERACVLLRAKFDLLIESKQYRSVVVDLENVSFMDSSGIGLLIGRFKKLKARNIPLMLSNPNIVVDKVFRVSGIYKMIPLIG